MRERTVYNVYTDPGHGWIKVPRAELHRLGIAAKITEYSYQRGEWVYLEEDQDASLFFRTKEGRGEVITQRLYAADKRSRIRGYARYQVTP